MGRAFSFQGQYVFGTEKSLSHAEQYQDILQSLLDRCMQQRKIRPLHDSSWCDEIVHYVEVIIH